VPCRADGQRAIAVNHRRHRLFAEVLTDGAVVAATARRAEAAATAPRAADGQAGFRDAATPAAGAEAWTDGAVAAATARRAEAAATGIARVARRALPGAGEATQPGETPKTAPDVERGAAEPATRGEARQAPRAADGEGSVPGQRDRRRR
jgi:hypothetical protein